MALSVNSTVSELIKSDKAKAILESYMPGCTNHPMLPMAMYMTLRQVAYEPEAGNLWRYLDEIDAKLKEI